jgi:hypothetical protein
VPPYLHLPSSSARRALATKFNLPYSDEMQDWEWEVADAARFEEFLGVYQDTDLGDDERFSLMEVLVQCAEDVSDTPEFGVFWYALKPLLQSRFELHRSTIEYWAVLEEEDPTARFLVSEPMRELLRQAAP